MDTTQQTPAELLTLPTAIKNRRFPKTAENILACIAEAFRKLTVEYGGAERTPRRGSLEIKRVSACLQNTGLSSIDVEKALDEFRRAYPVFDFETRADLYEIRPAMNWEFCGKNGFRPERAADHKVALLRSKREAKKAGQ